MVFSQNTTCQINHKMWWRPNTYIPSFFSIKQHIWARVYVVYFHVAIIGQRSEGAMLIYLVRRYPNKMLMCDLMVDDWWSIRLSVNGNESCLSSKNCRTSMLKLSLVIIILLESTTQIGFIPLMKGQEDNSLIWWHCHCEVLSLFMEYWFLILLEKVI